jgi:hypothetical protein
VSHKSALDRVLAFEPADWATNYTGVWIKPWALLVTVTAVPATAWTDAAGRAAVALGALRVSVMPTGGVVSADGSSAPSNASTVLSSGSWGDVVCDGQLFVHSHTAIVAAFTPPVSTPGYTPANYSLQVATSPLFPQASTRTLAVVAALSELAITLPVTCPAGSLRYLIPSLPPGAAHYVRVAAAVPPLPVEVSRVLPRPVAPVFWAIGASSACGCAVAGGTGAGCSEHVGIPVAIVPTLPIIGEFDAACERLHSGSPRWHRSAALALGPEPWDLSVASSVASQVPFFTRGPCARS